MAAKKKGVRHMMTPYPYRSTRCSSRKQGPKNRSLETVLIRSILTFVHPTCISAFIHTNTNQYLGQSSYTWLTKQCSTGTIPRSGPRRERSAPNPPRAPVVRFTSPRSWTDGKEHGRVSYNLGGSSKKYIPKSKTKQKCIQ